MAEKEKQRIERLILGCSGDVAVDGKIGQEIFNIVNYDIVRIFVLHEPGESVDPAGIGSESLFRIVSQPDRLAQTVENGGPPAWLTA